MPLNKLVSIKNNKKNKRLGRGFGSGKGKTSGRGTKGQKSRSGYNIPRRFEGGQTPLIQRLAKAKGFNSRKQKPAIVKIEIIEKHFNDGDVVSYKTLQEKKLVKNVTYGVKILGPGKLTKKIKIRDVKLTKKLLGDYRALMPEVGMISKTVKASKPSKSIKSSKSKLKLNPKLKPKE